MLNSMSPALRCDCCRSHTSLYGASEAESGCSLRLNHMSKNAQQLASTGMYIIGDES